MNLNVSQLQKTMDKLKINIENNEAVPKKMIAWQNKLMFMLVFHSYSQDLDYIPQSTELKIQLIQMLHFAARLNE